MPSPRTNSPDRRRFIAAAILIIGLACAGVIYLRAGPDAVSSYEWEETKQYQRTLELYGGTANVVASDFREWFASLWHGQRLAFTVAFITLATAFCCWFLARALEAHLAEDDDGDHGRGSH
jgi:hypothetical protein